MKVKSWVGVFGYFDHKAGTLDVMAASYENEWVKSSTDLVVSNNDSGTVINPVQLLNT